MTRKSIAFPFVLLLAGLLPHADAQEGAASAGQNSAGGREILGERPGEGERCIVCKQQVHGADVVEVRYKGRRFFVKEAMLPEFDADPERYFSELQARAGLFDERAVGGGRVSAGWLAFGGYVVIGLVFAALCGYLAIGRGHAPLPWFFAGLAGNAAALFVLLMTPRGDPTAFPAGVPPGLTKVPLTRAPVPCPHCGATNHPSAAQCGGCNQPLEAAVEPETARI